jgi:hypothetical protein
MSDNVIRRHWNVHRYDHADKAVWESTKMLAIRHEAMGGDPGFWDDFETLVGLLKTEVHQAHEARQKGMRR